MNRIKFVVAILALSFVCGSVSAQEFGRGRFLRKLRDDIMGSKKQSQKRQATKKKPTQKKTQPRGKTPTPITGSKQPGQRPPSKQSRSSQSRLSQYAAEKPSTRQRTSTRTQTAKKNDFGMRVSDGRSGDLVIAKVDPRGNAAEAGVRPGDVIKEIGGVPVTTENEFDEFTKILGEGDQMEFKIVRRGKEQTVNIQFGDIPKDQQETVVDSRTDSKLDSERQNGLRSVINNNTSFRPASTRLNTMQVESLQRTIQQQQQTIRQLQQEINRLRRGSTQSSRNGLFLNSPTK